MYEDIILPESKQPTKKEIKTPRPPKLRISLMPEPAITAFEIVKSVEDVRILGKLLDLCKSKIRRKKRNTRRERKHRRR